MTDPTNSPTCPDCGAVRALVGTIDGRPSYACAGSGCAAVRITSSVTLPASCEACDDATDHQVSELSNGDLVTACGACWTVTVMREPGPADAGATA